MNEMEKLRVLIPHWIEHNETHADEFKLWAEKAGEASEDILAAAKAMDAANEVLKSAMEKLGGPLAHHDHSHAD
jgi:hypothetical protein